MCSPFLSTFAWTVTHKKSFTGTIIYLKKIINYRVWLFPLKCIFNGISIIASHRNRTQQVQGRSTRRRDSNRRVPGRVPPSRGLRRSIDTPQQQPPEPTFSRFDCPSSEGERRHGNAASAVAMDTGRHADVTPDAAAAATVTSRPLGSAAPPPLPVSNNNMYNNRGRFI